MTSIHNIYEPYNFSKFPCHILSMPISVQGYNKLEFKLPEYLQKLKGVFASVDCKSSAGKLAGFLVMNFNDQALKNFQLPITRTNFYGMADLSHPIDFNEIILPNSYLQGFYYDNVGIIPEYPYTLKIYLHYEPLDKYKKEKTDQAN
jgi:hypothetical protein